MQKVLLGLQQSIPILHVYSVDAAVRALTHCMSNVGFCKSSMGYCIISMECHRAVFDKFDESKP